MHQQLKEITEVVSRSAGQLSGRYQAEDLYTLRTSIRRIRSILKQIRSYRSRRFRKIWGGFAAVTNDARDWDVFLVTVGALLSAGEIDTFEQINQPLVRSSHEAVLGMVRSMHWRRHLKEWNRYIDRAGDHPSSAESEQLTLDQVLTRARLKLAGALSAEEDRSWHKFRIAVKDVRYVADASTGDAATRQNLREISKVCRKLQTLLGDWHDATTQLQLLDELETAEVHARLREIIEQRKRLFLSQTHEFLAAEPTFTAVP